MEQNFHYSIHKRPSPVYNLSQLDTGFSWFSWVLEQMLGCSGVGGVWGFNLTAVKYIYHICVYICKGKAMANYP
jgi:hypothetical protein